MNSVDPLQLATLDPDDGCSHVDAIRELAFAVQEIQRQILILNAEVDDLGETVAALEHKSRS